MAFYPFNAKRIPYTPRNGGQEGATAVPPAVGIHATAGRRRYPEDESYPTTARRIRYDDSDDEEGDYVHSVTSGEGANYGPVACPRCGCTFGRDAHGEYEEVASEGPLGTSETMGQSTDLLPQGRESSAPTGAMGDGDQSGTEVGSESGNRDDPIWIDDEGHR